MRYKIKLVAANYLPSITVGLPHVQAALELMRKAPASKSTASASVDRDESSAANMHAGRTYPFHLAFTNPLYDPIQVRLHVQRTTPLGAPGTSAAEPSSGEKVRRPPFAVNLPPAAFPIAAFAEAWEYEDDEEMFIDEDFDGRRDQGRGRGKTVGILERRANVTVIGGEVVIGKEARGDIKVRTFIPSEESTE